MYRFLFVALAFTVLNLSACGPEPAPDTSPRTFDYLTDTWPHDLSDTAPDPAVRYGQLENGLRYAILQNARPENEVSLRLWIGAGARQEMDDELGLAHYLEHMAFNGSENVPEGEMVEQLQNYGMSFGADTNASTTFNRTLYKLDLPDTSDELVDYSLSLFRETADRLLLEDEAIERERGVILSEERRSDTPGRAAYRARQDFFYPDALITTRNVIGSPDSISAITPVQMRAFYDVYYRPERAFLVVVGDIDPDAMEAKVTDMFSDWRRAPDAVPNPDLGDVPPWSLDARVYVDEELSLGLTLLEASDGTAQVQSTDTSFDALTRNLGSNIVNARLRTRILQGDSPLQGASIYASRGEFSDTRSVSLTPKGDDWTGALSLAEQEIRRAAQYGFSQEEIDREISEWDRYYRDAVAGADKRYSASLAESLSGAFGGGGIFRHPRQSLEVYEAWKAQLTREDVEAAFSAAWSDFTPKIFVQSPQDIDGGADRILDVWRTSQRSEVTPPDILVTKDFAYTDFGPSGEVVFDDRIEDMDIRRIRFDNGVRLNMKVTDFDDQRVYVRVALGDGWLAYPEDKPGLNRLSSLLSLGGLEAHDAEELNRIFSGQHISTGLGVGPTQMSLSTITHPDDLTSQFQVWTAMLTAPGYREVWLTRFRDSLESAYPTVDSTPGGVSSRDVPRLIRSGDPRFGLQPEDQLMAYDLDDVRAVLGPEFETGAIEIGVVGDFDPEEIIRIVGATLGALPERDREFTDWDGKADIAFPAADDVTLTHNGQPTQARFEIYWPVSMDWDARTSRQLSLMGDIYSDKLREGIREEAGLSYAPSAGVYVSRIFEGYGYVSTVIDIAPGDEATVEALISEIAADMRAGNFDEDELNRARKPILENIEAAEKQNSSWLGTVVDAQSREEDLQTRRDWISDYEQTTLEDLRALSARTFDPEQAFIVRIRPAKQP